MERATSSTPVRLAAALARWVALVALALVAARASAAQSMQQRERIEPATAATAPAWLTRALAHRTRALPPAPPTDDPHASALTVELVVAEPRPGAPSVALTELVVEVLVLGREPGAPGWTAAARVDAGGRAKFERVPEGRPHVSVLAPDCTRMPLVPDPALYGLLFEPFSGGPFPHLALDEVPVEGGARVVRLQLVPGRAAEGRVELAASSPLGFPGARAGEVAGARPLAWVASPGWLQLAPLGVDGAFRWHDPRPAPTAPFDPAAPSAGFLERLTGGVAGPFGAAGEAWRACAGVPAPPVGHTFVIELAAEDSVERARRALDDGLTDALADDHPTAAPSPAELAALARWRALCAVPIEAEGATTHALTRAERAALAAELLLLSRAEQGMEGLIAEACRLRQGGPETEAPEWAQMFPEQPEILGLAREWLALGAEGLEEAELALLDRAHGPVFANVDQYFIPFFSADVPLQLWIDVVAPRYPDYASALAAHDPCLRAPERSTARGALPAGLSELQDPVSILAALRKRPSSTLGAELTPIVQAAPREVAERLLTGFAALARDEARGPTVRAGAVDLLLALGARTAGDGRASAGARLAELGLAEIVLAALGDEPADVARTESVLAALAPLAPARALADARAVLDAIARDVTRFHASMQSPNGRSGAEREPQSPFGALLVLAALEPTELAQRARETPELATVAAASLLLEGRDALDARGLPFAFLERLLR